MKTNKVILSLVTVGALFVSAAAYAEITSISGKLAGGCLQSNRSGSCIIKATARGTNLAGEVLRLQKTTSGYKGNYFNFGRTRTLGSSGKAEWRFVNDPSANVCYRVKNMPTKIRSREMCIPK